MDKPFKLRGISGWILKLFGWEVFVNYPKELKKMLYVVAPHTSNWDFPLGVLVRKTIGAKAHFIGKHSLFKFPLGILMRWLNGIPLNRDKSINFVDQVAEVFKQHEEMIIQIAPEGTRKKVDRFKTGFYHIAKKAEIPIIPVLFDWANKKVIFKDAFYPGKDSKKDIREVEEMFKSVVGKNPKNSFE